MLDIVLGRNANRTCNGISRRDMLRVGTLAPLGLSLSQLLSLQSAQAAEGLSLIHI